MLVVTSASYYLVRQLVVQYQLATLRDSLMLLRQTHPWIGISIWFVAPIHILAMFQTYPPDRMRLKILFGQLLGLTLLVQLVLGIRLKLKPSEVNLRLLHRRIMFVVLPVLLLHYLWPFP